MGAIAAWTAWPPTIQMFISLAKLSVKFSIRRNKSLMFFNKTKSEVTQVIWDYLYSVYPYNNGIIQEKYRPNFTRICKCSIHRKTVSGLEYYVDTDNLYTEFKLSGNSITYKECKYSFWHGQCPNCNVVYWESQVVNTKYISTSNPNSHWPCSHY